MKKYEMMTRLLSVAILIMTAFVMSGQPQGIKLKRGNEAPKDSLPKIALAYVEDYRTRPLDPFLYTHMIYAALDFNDSYDGILVPKPQKLQAMVDLKKQNPDLKIIVGVGTVRREGFSEMTRDKKKRKSFVKSVKHLIDSLSLDGIDLDWEFPTTEDGGHTANPKDDINYASLVKDLRKALGKDKWISYYSHNSGKFIDHKRMVPYVTFVNVSGYNLAVPKEGERGYHQSPLYPSEKLGEWCISKVIETHINLGIPKEKILMGIPLYGRGKSPFPTYVESHLYDKYAGDLTPQWDEDAQAPYYADEDGNLVMGFDDERSIAAKFDFIRANGMPGIFIWNYDADFDDQRLSKAIQRLRK